MTELEKELTIKVKRLEDDCKAYNFTQHTLQEEIKELEDKLANADYQLEGRDNEIRELKEKIEKMKCCYNCSKWNEGLLLCNDSTVRVTTYADYCCEDWEIKENE
jgi:uncharacterized protein HemX